MSEDRLSQFEMLKQIRSWDEPTLDLQPEIDASAQLKAAKGMSEMAEALTIIEGMPNVKWYEIIPQARSASRVKRENFRLEQDALDREQARRHADELHAIEVRRKNAATVLAESTATKASA